MGHVKCRKGRQGTWPGPGYRPDRGQVPSSDYVHFRVFRAKKWLWGPIFCQPWREWIIYWFPKEITAFRHFRQNWQNWQNKLCARRFRGTLKLNGQFWQFWHFLTHEKQWFPVQNCGPVGYFLTRLMEITVFHGFSGNDTFLSGFPGNEHLIMCQGARVRVWSCTPSDSPVRKQQKQ